MSLQIFLHGKILGIEDFLRNATDDAGGKAQYATLISEILPRALLAEFGLSKVLLGSSGGGQFLLVLPQEVRAEAETFCRGVAEALDRRTAGSLKLVYSVTENLGDWSDIRKRLLTDLHARMATLAAMDGLRYFSEADEALEAPAFDYEFREGSRAGWSPDRPADISAGEGKHTWTLGEEIPFARHAAPNDDGTGEAGLNELASRARGQWIWGVLRGDVDDFGVRLRRANTAEEHIQLSLMYKQFFAGEVQMRCSLPEYWQKVSILYTGGQDFAAYGAWDALIGLARELQRLFAVFAEANLKEYAGPEGKTISMAISLARDEDATLAGVYAEAGERLRTAKAAGRDSVWVLGRTLEWKQLADAAESHATMTRLIREFGVPAQFLDELARFYRDTPDTIVTPGVRRANARVDRPWRFYRRLNTMLGTQGRSREFQRLRSDLISDFTGRRASNVRLRPQGRVALEWARLEIEAI